MELDLTDNEMAFLMILRKFDFLRPNGYSLKNSVPIYVTMEKVIDLNVNFIQQNLMPVIRGEIWINELLKQRT